MVILPSIHCVFNYCHHVQWRTEDFRMGGVEVPQKPRGVGRGEGVSVPSGEGSG